MSHGVRVLLVPFVHQGGHFHSRLRTEFLPPAVHCLIYSRHGIEPVTYFLQGACHRDSGRGLAGSGGLRGACNRDGYVVWHHPALHEHPCLLSYNMEDADKWLGRTLQNLQNLTFLALAVSLFLGHRHSDNIPVQGTSHLGCLDEYVIFLPFHYDEAIAFPRHLHAAREFRKTAFLLFLFFAAAVLAPAPVPSCHNIDELICFQNKRFD